MLTQPILEFIRRFLTRSLEKIERLETATPRAKRKAWYQIDYHFPPMVVAITSAIILYFVLWWNLDLTVVQSVALVIFVLLLVGLFSFYVSRDHAQLAKNDDAMALLAVIFFTDLFFIKFVALFSGQAWITPYITPISIGPLLAALLLHQRIAVILSFIV